ncbi:MAG: fibronectin type III domain-containing protein, partial [Anaerolineales bacterium]|nr:fibronectin type III domain-containing protein [Anaerolineales bacterium]
MNFNKHYILLALVLIAYMHSHEKYTMISIPETQGYIGDSSSPNCIRGPYLQIGTPNSIIIRWRTNIDTNSRLRYWTDSTSLDQVVDSLSITTEHEVTLSGLLPSTKYYYSVETMHEVLSTGPDNYFVTAPPIGTKKKSRIWILGDSGTANDNAASVRDAYYNVSEDIYTDLW